MAAHVRLDGLLCTSDHDVLRVLQPALDSFAIQTQVCAEIESAVEAINHRRLDAVIVDWKGEYSPTRVLFATRSSSWNSRSTILAMVDPGPGMLNALRAGANFLIPKPSDTRGVSRCLRAAYGTILQQRRKVARCPVDIPVIAKFSEIGKVEARIIDLSVGGLALQCKQLIEVERQVSLSFLLPESNILINVAGNVVNADRNGRAGICFSFIPHDELQLLENWLAVELAKLEEAEIPVCETDGKDARP
jgi:ActR/RegA family two-component response regulator